MDTSLLPAGPACFGVAVALVIVAAVVARRREQQRWPNTSPGRGRSGASTDRAADLSSPGRTGDTATIRGRFAGLVRVAHLIEAR